MTYQPTNADVLAARRWIAAESLSDYVRLAWDVVEPGQPYVHGWHMDAMCEHLEAVTSGQITRLLINVPPGMTKSLTTGVFFPSHEWGPKGLPHMRYVTASHEQTLAIRDNLRMRRLVASEWYQRLWPVTLTKDQNAKLNFENQSGGYRAATAAASMTGRRGDRVIIDDPHSVQGAESEAERQSVIEWFTETVPTRLNNPRTSAIIVIMQRLHEEDVSGVILARELGYDALILPMEFEADRRCRTSIGFSDPRTFDGELLFPERFPAEVVARDKRVLGPFATAGQFQQRPSPRGGGLFRAEWFHRYRDPPAVVAVYGSSDYAVTENEGDYTVHRVWGIAPSGDIYMLAGWKGQTSSDVWIDRKLDLIRDWRPLVWFGEGGVIHRAIEPALKRRMRERNIFCRLEWIPSIHDKVTRARGLEARAAAGTVYIPEGEDGDGWIDQLTRFPSAKHDDEVDAASLIGRALDMAHPAIARREQPVNNPRDRYFRHHQQGIRDWKTA